MKATELIQKLEALGWKQDRQRGSHKIFKHPDHQKLIAVPDHGKKDLKPGLLNAILKEAGLK